MSHGRSGIKNYACTSIISGELANMCSVWATWRRRLQLWRRDFNLFSICHLHDCIRLYFFRLVFHVIDDVRLDFDPFLSRLERFLAEPLILLVFSLNASKCRERSKWDLDLFRWEINSRNLSNLPESLSLRCLFQLVSISSDGKLHNMLRFLYDCEASLQFLKGSSLRDVNWWC